MVSEIHKLGDMTYPFLLNVVKTYQKNYIGADKMSKEYMLKRIEKFKRGRDEE